MSIKTKIWLWGVSFLWLLLCVSLGSGARGAGVWTMLIGAAPIGSLFAWEWMKARRTEKTKEELLRMLGLHDGQGYAYARGGSGIAVNPAARRLALFEGGVGKDYPLSDVREWEAVREKAAQIRYNRLSMQLGATAENIGAAVEAARNTGFFVTVRDVDHPIWRVEMAGKDDQARWMEILRQQVNEPETVAA